eukprot:6174491-Pleurochrysis_carterae.AAC.1
MAANAVANTLDEVDIKTESVVPNVSRIREVNAAVATAVVIAANEEKLAGAASPSRTGAPLPPPPPSSLLRSQQMNVIGSKTRWRSSRRELCKPTPQRTARLAYPTSRYVSAYPRRTPTADCVCRCVCVARASRRQAAGGRGGRARLRQ